jgi:chromosome segregation ATPase
MADEQADYSQIYDFLYRIDRRVGYLERDAAFIEKQALLLEAEKSKRFDSLKKEISRLHESLSEIKQNFNSCSHWMSSLSKELKNNIKKEDIDGLNARMEEIKFEEYVTHRDVKRGL